VFLVEAGTHLLCDALISPYRRPERVQVRRLLRSLTPGMLLMWDRRLYLFRMVHATLATGAHYLITLLNAVSQELMLLGSRGDRAVAPGVVATPGDIQPLAHQGNRDIHLREPGLAHIA
jgi:hypothetical protein